MGIFDKLLGKKTVADSKSVRDGSTIIMGGDALKTAEAFRSNGVRDILTCWSSSELKDFSWPEGEVKGLTLCFNHNIPIGVINYDKWFGQVLGGAGLDRWGKEPEIKVSCVPTEKKGMILLHWNMVDQNKSISTAENLEKSIRVWS